MAAADTTESILLEAGSDPAFMKLQGDTAPLELLAEVCKFCIVVPLLIRSVYFSF